MWYPINGVSAERIAVDTNGDVWIVNKNGDIFKSQSGSNNQFVLVPGSAEDIAARNGVIMHLSKKEYGVGGHTIWKLQD